jgi:hypothetical protein
MKVFKSMVLALAAVALTIPHAIVAAHEDAAQHGGVVVDSGHHHLEIVAKDGVIELYVGGDHGTPEMVSDAKASAAVLSEGKKVDVELKPDGETVLKGTGDFKVAKGSTIVITLTMPEHEPEQVRVKLD